MNVASYVQQRQYGSTRSRQSSQRKIESFLESKFTKSFVNKPCDISGKCRSTFVMQFSCDGTKVASTHGDHSVRVTDIATGKCLHTLRGHPRTPWSLAYHPSYSNILASGCLGGQVRIWDLYGHGCEVWNTENEAVVASLTFHPTDQVLVIAAGNTVYFWDWTNPEPFTKCSTSHEYERIRWIQFDSLGHTLYTGISNNTSVHRDELSNISHTGEEVRPPSSQPSRLSSVYDNIVGYYQDFRRDRLLSQLGPAGATGAGGTGQLGSTASTRSAVSSLVSAGVGGIGSAGMTTALENSGLNQTSVADVLAGGRPVPSHVSTSVADYLGRRSGFDVYLDSQNDNNGANTSANRGSVSLLHGISSLPLIDPVIGISRALRPLVPGLPADGARRRGRWQSYDYLRRGFLNGTGNLQPSTQSIFGSLSESDSEPLLNPRNDPLLSSATQSTNEDLENPTTGLASEIRNMARPLTAPVRRVVSESTLSRQYLPPIDVTDEIEIPLEAVTGQYMRQQPSGSILPTQQSNNRADLSGAVTVANRISSIMSAGHSYTSHSTNTSQSIVSSVTAPGVSNSSVNTSTSVFLSGYLQRLTQGSGATTSTHSASVSSQSKVFPSIRERLQSCMPLCPVTSSASKGNVSLTQTTGIPKVTIIMSSHTAGQPSVSGPCEQPRSALDTTQVLGMSGNNSLSQLRQNYSTVTSTSCSNVTTCETFQDRLNAAGISSATVVGVKPCVSANISAKSATNGAGDLTVSSSLASRGSLLSTRCRQMIPSSTESDGTLSSSFNGNVSSSSENIPAVAMNTPTVVASTSSHSTLFENIFHSSSSIGQSPGVNSSQQSGRGRNNLSTYRSQPYNWQNRGRYLSLMGPYLQSRGLNPSVTERTSYPAEDLQSHDNVLSSLQSTGLDSASLQREQASSDTENELSAHLSRSGAYFMPIPEHQLRAASSASLRSSASLDRNTDPSSQRQYSVSAGSTDSSQGQRSDSAHSQRSRSGSTTHSQEGEVELVVDQNENYTTNRNINPDTRQREEIVHSSQDRNNNSIHIAVNNNPGLNSVSQGLSQRDPDYVRLRNSFVSMTDQIEREMNDLNRRINALRDSFNESIRSLRHDRHRYETVDGELPAETATNLGPQGVGDMPALPETSGHNEDDSDHSGLDQTAPVSQPPTLLESSLRTHAQRRGPLHPRSQPGGDNAPTEDSHHWRTLQRHYLHPHYSSSILDETINRPNNMIQSAINRAIAGAFMGTGESAVANNIINQTHRIQHWDFTKCHIPDISQSKVNIVVPHCKLHNSASADISQDNTLLATFVPNHHGFPDNSILAVYSLLPATRGQCLYTKQFGPNAVSVSISPSNSYILVCLAAKRLTWVFTTKQLVAHIYKLEKKKAGENSMRYVKDVHHTCSSDVRTHVSGNSACWLPVPGDGLVYGTNRGDLHICRPGVKNVTGKADCVDSDSSLDDIHGDSTFQRLFGPVPWRMYASRNRVSTSTQTARVRRSAGTQTPQDV